MRRKAWRQPLQGGVSHMQRCCCSSGSRGRSAAGLDCFRIFCYCRAVEQHLLAGFCFSTRVIPATHLRLPVAPHLPHTPRCTCQVNSNLSWLRRCQRRWRSRPMRPGRPGAPSSPRGCTRTPGCAPPPPGCWAPPLRTRASVRIQGLDLMGWNLPECCTCLHP